MGPWDDAIVSQISTRKNAATQRRRNPIQNQFNSLLIGLDLRIEITNSQYYDSNIRGKGQVPDSQTGTISVGNFL